MGNQGSGTADYRSYGREHRIQGVGKPVILASSDPAFRGDGSRYNPEELLLASLSSCHMLWYLHLCAVNGIVVVDYHDRSEGVMVEHRDGAGEFSVVTLRPKVRIQTGDPAKALALHDDAHRYCFIARSVRFEVRHEPTVQLER